MYDVTGTVSAAVGSGNLDWIDAVGVVVVSNNSKRLEKPQQSEPSPPCCFRRSAPGLHEARWAECKKILAHASIRRGLSVHVLYV